MCWPKGKAERRYAGITHIDCTALTATEAARINAYCGDHGVAISGLGTTRRAPANADEARVAVEQILRVIDAAQLLGIGVVNTFIGRDPQRSVDQLGADGRHLDADP